MNIDQGNGKIMRQKSAQPDNKIIKRLLVTVLCLLAVAGCRGVDSDGGIADNAGDLSLWITDAPVQGVDRVDITITGVQIQPAEGDVIDITLDEPLRVDLLDLVDEPELREEILDDYSLPVGNYDSIRLVLDESRLVIEVAGSEFIPTIPADAQDGLQVPFNVNVEDDTDLDLTIDFDVRKSLRKISDTEYELQPSLRIVRTERTGNLTGSVAENRIRDPDCENGIDHNEGNYVYVFGGGSANFQDIQGNEGDPLATGVVDLNFSSGQYEFLIGFLPRGSYTAVFTCDGAIDDPELDNSINMIFSEAVDFEINAGETTLIAFD